MGHTRYGWETPVLGSTNHTTGLNRTTEDGKQVGGMPKPKAPACYYGRRASCRNKAWRRCAWPCHPLRTIGFSIVWSYLAVATLVFAVVWFSSARAQAQQSKPADSDNGRTEQVMLRTADGQDLQGVLGRFSLTDGAVIRTTSGVDRRLDSRDIVAVETGKVAQPPLVGDVTVRLVGGDVLYGRLSGSLPEGLRLKTVDLGSVEIPLDAVTSVECYVQDSATRLPDARGRKRMGVAPDDTVLLRNGDVLHGFVLGIDAGQILLEQGTDTVPVNLELASAVYLAATAPPGAAGLYAVATLTHSGRVTFTEITWNDGSFEARCRHGAQVRLAGAAVVKLDILGGRWEWLAQHQPVSFEHTPMLGLGFDYVADRNVLGEPLVVAGRAFAHGIGVHSRTRLVYDLRGQYQEFVTQFGLDDDSGTYADVDVVILLDGRQLLERSHVRAGTLLGPFRLDVARGKRLELIVDFGAASDLQDRFDWIDPALVH